MWLYLVYKESGGGVLWKIVILCAGKNCKMKEQMNIKIKWFKAKWICGKFLEVD